MKILIVGGAGFIGSATAAILTNAGHDVVVYDSLVKGNRPAVPDSIPFIEADLADADTLDAAFAEYQPDAVAHFAAFIEAGESMKDPGLFYKNNVANTVTLLDTMMKHDVKKLVFSSTAGVYASKDTPMQESDPIAPANAYAGTKLAVEQMLSWYHKVYGLRYAVLRYFNAAGAMLDDDGNAIRGEAHTPESHLIPLILQVALGQRESILIFGSDYDTPDGTCIRDYIHIEDLATAHELALQALDNTSTMTYNLGTGQGYSVREVIETARRVTGHPIPAIESPRRPGDAPILIASADAIHADLGWQPRYPDLDTIIQSAWRWHQTHPDGY